MDRELISKMAWICKRADDDGVSVMDLQMEVMSIEAAITPRGFQAKSNKPSNALTTPGGRPDAKRFTGTCFKCGEVGHRKSECKKKGGAGGGDKKRPKCTWCGKTGHTQEQCFAKREHEEKKREKPAGLALGASTPVDMEAQRWEEDMVLYSNPFDNIFSEMDKENKALYGAVPAAKFRFGYNPEDFQLLGVHFAELWEMVGGFDIDGAADDYNAQMGNYCSRDGMNFFDVCLAGYKVYCNPPFKMIEKFLTHYFRCKRFDPEETSAVWILPKKTDAAWWPLVKNMEQLKFLEGGNNIVLVSVPRRQDQEVHHGALPL
jgi:hypothetical protein